MTTEPARMTLWAFAHGIETQLPAHVADRMSASYALAFAHAAWLHLHAPELFTKWTKQYQAEMAQLNSPEMNTRADHDFAEFQERFGMLFIAMCSGHWLTSEEAPWLLRHPPGEQPNGNGEVSG